MSSSKSRTADQLHPQDILCTSSSYERTVWEICTTFSTKRYHRPEEFIGVIESVGSIRWPLRWITCIVWWLPRLYTETSKSRLWDHKGASRDNQPFPSEHLLQEQLSSPAITTYPVLGDTFDKACENRTVNAFADMTVSCLKPRSSSRPQDGRFDRVSSVYLHEWPMFCLHLPVATSFSYIATMWA